MGDIGTPGGAGPSNWRYNRSARNSRCLHLEQPDMRALTFFLLSFATLPAHLALADDAPAQPPIVQPPIAQPPIATGAPLAPVAPIVVETTARSIPMAS